MIIALASVPVVNKDIGHNLSVILQTMSECSGHADMVVFGESALQGFDCLCWDHAADLRMAVSQQDECLSAIRTAARQLNIAVSFGCIEAEGDVLYSTQFVIDASGDIIHRFHRVSQGWKEYWRTDAHYQEGERFESFEYGGKRFAIGLCGDLWTEGRPEEMRALHADIVLWPVWCDFTAEEWNQSEKHEYARQAALCGECVLYVNPFCTDEHAPDKANGGCAFFKDGSIVNELPAGKSGILFVELPSE